VHRFGSNLDFYVCYIDEGGIVDTEISAGRLLDHYKGELSAYLANLDNTIKAFMDGDLRRIAFCATESAKLSQRVMPKRHFDAILSYQMHFKADGIVVAHTGSLLGYLFIEKLNCVAMGELSAFFFSLGYQCRFARTCSI
jgi:uncharacterized protein involved in propanediol utilization